MEFDDGHGHGMPLVDDGVVSELGDPALGCAIRRAGVHQAVVDVHSHNRRTVGVDILQRQTRTYGANRLNRHSSPLYQEKLSCFDLPVFDEGVSGAAVQDLAQRVRGQGNDGAGVIFQGLKIDFV